MEEKIINIVIADDHAFLREGIKKTIQDEIDMKIIGEASNAIDAIAIIKELDPDVVIMDISMPGKSGLEVLKDLKAMKKKYRVLILSMHPEDRFAIRALKAGAAGYLTKESAPDELVKAIRTVLTGRKYVSKALAEKLVDILSDDMDKQPHELLSDREYEVFIKIASGKKAVEIAAEISISVHTVNTYRARILEKLNMNSNVELTQYAMHNNLID
ncbi:MAG TPA: response regulator transcription factor [Ignavibacteria bacterium]|nr:response regulator transcription factor [Ignavibacteria bacterium]HMQ98951.1 response regulator transcription factor [Ignavibacteria bacterium]